MLNWVEHEKSVITSGPGFSYFLQINQVQGYKKCFMLNSAEHEILNAKKH